MDGAVLSPFPCRSWLGFRVTANAGPQPLCVQVHGVVHTVSLTLTGGHTIRWIAAGRENRWTERAGAVHFLPADGERRTFLTAPEPSFESAVLVLPRRHLDACRESDGLDGGGEPRRILAHDDPELRACLRRLVRAEPDGAEGEGPDRDEAGRRLVRRLHELGGGRRPDWHDDASTFDRRTLDRLVDHIDAHLRRTPSLADMGRVAGLSPSHFARKFRATTGLSLQRFANRRRLQAALDVLRDGRAPLAGLARDLGFASQSHFTRLFSCLTGMTPARYRKQRSPTVG